MKIDSLLGSSYSISNDLSGLGTAYLAKQNFELASHYHHRALKLTKDPLVMFPSLLEIGKIHLHWQTLDSAGYYFEAAMKEAEEARLKNEKKEALLHLYQLESTLGNFEKALQYHQHYVELKDSLFNEENIRKIANIESDFRNKQEQQGLEIAKNLEINRVESVRNVFIVGTLLTSIIAFLIYLIYRRKNQANEKLNGLYETVKDQAEQLKALDQTKSRFFSNISHELRTPLTLISSPLEHLLTLNHRKIDPYIQDHLKLMNQNTQQLKVLVDDILDLSKLEADKLENEKEALDLPFFVNCIFSNFEALAKHRQIDYQLNLDSLPENVIQVDQKKLEKILNNLLSNAFKFTPAGSEVRFLVKESNRSIHFEVKDDGQGIDAEDLPFIFDRFFQSKQPNEVLQGGSGIGLALSKELAGIIGGQLNVSSERGRGSVFTLSIPYEIAREPNEVLQMEDTSKVLISYAVGTPDDNKKQMTSLPAILIVEDHPEMQAFIKGLLQPTSSNVLLANNGKEALDLLSRKTVDLIISDVMMPEMDGHELLKALRQQETYSGIPFILLTALKSETHHMKALSLGVDDYLTKPFSPVELIARVQNMLARQESRRTFLSEASIDNQENRTITDEHQYKFKISEKDKEFVNQVEHILLSHLEDEAFSMKELADILCLSLRQMERNIKSIIGLTPKQLQQEVAMQYARKLLEERKYGNPTAIAYSVGIRHVTRFSNLYEERFGKRPESYFL